MKRGRLQLKDLPTKALLQYIKNNERRVGRWVTCHELREQVLEKLVPEFAALPFNQQYRLTALKLSSLEKKGLASGCIYCSCDGWVLGDRGKLFVEEPPLNEKTEDPFRLHYGLTLIIPKSHEFDHACVCRLCGMTKARAMEAEKNFSCKGEPEK